MKHILSIDPSINFCGYAVHTNKGALIEYDIILSNKKLKEDFVSKSRDIVGQIIQIIEKYSNIQLVLEMPQYWGVAGYLARESGAIFKLTFLCGMICGLQKDIVTVVPQKWKGQMPKHVMQNRLQKYYPKINFKETNHNILDAIGIGYYYINGKV